MSQHQSQSNLNLLCDNNSNFVVAKVSGHSNSNNSRGKHSITKIQDKINCDGNNKSNMISNHPHNPTSKHNNNNGNINFARVSIKQMKSKIQLNNSTYSLTLLESATSAVGISSMLTGNNTETIIANKNSNLILSNNDDISTVTSTNNNCDSNVNKHFIKSKSITDFTEQSINPIVFSVEADDAKNCNDEINSSVWNAKHNKINLINNQNTTNNNLNICEASTVALDDDKDDESGTNSNNKFVQQKLSTTSGCLRNNSTDNNNDMLFHSHFQENNLNNCIETSTTATATPTIIPPTLPLASSEKPQRIANLTVSSSCSSTSNENNNAILVKNGQLVSGDDDMELTDEEKLLNVNQKRNTNPFLINNIQLEGNNQHDVKLTSSETTMNEEIIENKTATSSLECNEINVQTNGILKHIQLQTTSIPIEMVAVDSCSMLTTKTQLKARSSIIPHEKQTITSNSGIENHQDNSFLDYDEEDSDEFCKSEIFDNPNSVKMLLEHNKTAVNVDDKKYNRQKYETTQSWQLNNRFKINQNDQPTSIMNDNDNSFIIKSAIPTCSFQRQDYRLPGEIPDNDTTGNSRKFFTSNKKPKSGELFHMPSFSKTGKTPTLKHANLNYPNKTCHNDVIGCANDKKYFEKIHSKAKYQLIKLGQKCKILTHHQPTTVSTIPGGGSMSNVKTTIIKTNTNHRQKYQYYNEINKSYQLDDFIRTTHLLNGDKNEDLTQQQQQSDDLNNRNSVVYKTYKSEIDLTRNLTYLNAFLNDNFDREPTTTTVAITTPTKKQSKSKNHHNHHHKRAKSCSKNINYITSTTIATSNANDQLTMINDVHFNGIVHESIDGELTPRPSIAYCNDDNVTSSSFEYQASIKRPKKEMQEQMSGEKSGRSNTTSSSLSSSDYASVYSGPTNVIKDNNGRNHGQVNESRVAGGKLISTPEETLEFYDRSFVDRSPRQKRKPKLRTRRSSQPIPEHTNTLPYDDIDDQIMLFDESNFVELKNNMKKFHPDLYNSVPQFEDLNAIDFYENPNYHHYNGEGDNEIYNPYSDSGNGQLSSSYNDQTNVHHQDYLEHFNVQQQLLDHGGGAGTSVEQISNRFLMTNGYGYGSSNNRQNTTSLIHPKHSNTPRDFYYNSQSTGNTQNDVYGSRKLLKNTQNSAVAPTTSTNTTYGHPHRVIVSKSKKQKGELVLEYEC